MKKYGLLVLALLLCGCRAEETFETISDEIVTPVIAQPRQITVRLPEDAVLPVLESDTEQIYLAEDYEIILQQLDSGDMEDTVRTLSGYEPDQLTIVQTQQEDVSRREFVWVSTGETGDRLGRAVILDDGNYHYCMSVLRDASTMEDSQIAWSEVFQSFTLA